MPNIYPLIYVPMEASSVIVKNFLNKLIFTVSSSMQVNDRLFILIYSVIVFSVIKYVQFSRHFNEFFLNEIKCLINLIKCPRQSVIIVVRFISDCFESSFKIRDMDCVILIISYNFFCIGVNIVFFIRF